MVGISLERQGITTDPQAAYVSVKEAVFPFAKFPGVDIVLGPEMRSTGEVMGIATDFPTAFAKSQLAISSGLPTEGTILISVARAGPSRNRADRSPAGGIQFRLLCTAGTAGTLEQNGIDVEVIRKIHEGRPNVLDYLVDGTIDLIVNTPSGKGARTDEGRIRAAAICGECLASRPWPEGAPRRGVAAGQWSSERESSRSSPFRTCFVQQHGRRRSNLAWSKRQRSMQFRRC